MSRKKLILIIIVIIILVVVYIYSRRLDDNQKVIWNTLKNDPNESVKRKGNTIVLYTSKYFSEPVVYKKKGVVESKVGGKKITGSYTVNSEGRPVYTDDFNSKGDIKQ